jgi:hypothetical protein
MVGLIRTEITYRYVTGNRFPFKQSSFLLPVAEAERSVIETPGHNIYFVVVVVVVVAAAAAAAIDIHTIWTSKISSPRRRSPLAAHVVSERTPSITSLRRRQS